MKQVIFFVLLAIGSHCFAQTCNSTDELIALPGILWDHTKLPIGGGSFVPAEKSQAIKTLTAAENICKNKFVLHGGEAKSWFNVTGKVSFDLYNLTSYYYKIGFYQFVCVGGKKSHSNEYGVDFSVTANPVLNNSVARVFNGVDFYLDTKKQNSPLIAFCRYMRINSADAEKINTGKGYIDNTLGNDYKTHTDVYRNWYISKPGNTLLLPVARRTYLQSLLEYFDREKIYYIKQFTAKLESAKKYIETYRNNGNAAMLQSSISDKLKADQALETIEKNYQIKKQRVEKTLAGKSTEWLNEPAVLDPNNSYCTDKYGDATRNQAECFLFDEFYAGENGETVYQWNPDVFREGTAQPSRPIFFRVQFRFKAGEKFSANIAESFVKDFDFYALQRLLN